MAVFREDGLRELGLTIQEISEIPEDIVYEMLEAEAAVVVSAHKREINTQGIVDTGQLQNSIKAKRGKTKDGGVRVDVYPTGTRDDGVRNAEVGFIQEYGAPHKGIAPHQWMRTANESCADEAINAALDVYDKYLASKNL